MKLYRHNFDADTYELIAEAAVGSSGTDGRGVDMLTDPDRQGNCWSVRLTRAEAEDLAHAIRIMLQKEPRP